jgi:hypothetical protein
MQASFLHPQNHYLRFSIAPSTKNELAIRKTIADALTQGFGITSAATYLDVLWISEDGKDCVIRIKEG